MPKMEHNEAYNHPHDYAGLVSAPLMVNSTAPEFATRANNHPSSNFISAFPACFPSNAGMTNSSYVNMYNGGSTSFPPNQVPHWLPPYNQSLRGDGCSTSHSHIDRVVSFKRKGPTIPLADETNIVRYPPIGSHMNYPSYPSSIEPNVPPPPENLSLNTTGMPACYMSDTNPPGEGSLRNVRSRHSEDFHPPAWFYASRDMPYSLYTSDDAVSGSRMTQQWSHFPAHMVPHGWIPPADAISFSHRSNQPTTRDNVGNGINATNSVYRSHLEQNRNQNAPMPILPSIITTGPVQSASAHNYSFIPYSNRAVGAPVGVETTSSSRSSRLLPIMGHTSPGVSARGAHQRSHLMNHRLNTPNRWAPEFAMVTDRLAFYDAANLHDLHRGMRLDIDGMSYEELLALGERIGNVNTGLSEDSVSSCLVKTVHRSCEQIQDEGKCAICLVSTNFANHACTRIAIKFLQEILENIKQRLQEEYKENKILGRLKCGHEYHICCISQWLKMKNVCPICRVSASSDDSGK